MTRTCRNRRVSVVCLQVDIITQTETLYDLVDERDHSVIGDALNPSSDAGMLSSSAVATGSSVSQYEGVVSFVCRMNTAARGVRYVPAPIKPGFERTRASVACFQ